MKRFLQRAEDLPTVDKAVLIALVTFLLALVTIVGHTVLGLILQLIGG